MPQRKKPDFERLNRVLRRKPVDRPVLFEFLIDEDLLRRHSSIFQNAEKGSLEYFAMIIDAFKNLGYDYAPLYLWDTNTLKFEKAEHAIQASYSLNQAALITDRASYENYRGHPRTWQAGDFS